MRVTAGAASRPSDLDFDSVYEEHVAFVWRSLASLGVPPARLEDATQDVFIVVHNKLATFEGRSAITTWLYGIARNVAHEHIRRVVRERAEVERATLPEPPPAESPEEAARRHEARTFLLALLEVQALCALKRDDQARARLDAGRARWPDLPDVRWHGRRCPP